MELDEDNDDWERRVLKVGCGWVDGAEKEEEEKEVGVVTQPTMKWNEIN